MANDFSTATKQIIEDGKLRKKEFEEEKELLKVMAEALESAGLKAEDNAEYAKRANKLTEQELKFRKKNADSPAARKEIKNEQASAAKQNQGLLGKIAGSLIGIGKQKVKKISGGLLTFLKGTALAGLLVALLAFLESDTWKKMKENIVTFLTDPSLKSFFQIFDKVGKFAIIGAIAGLVLLFGPIRIAMLAGGTLYKATKGLVGMFLKGGIINKGIGRLSGMISGAFGTGGAAPKVELGKDGKPIQARDAKGRFVKSPPVAPKAGTGGLAKVGKGLLRGARFLGPIGLAITGIMGVFDGITAGMEEAKKENSTKMTVMREASAGVISGFTFGLISQETISGAFTSIGDKFVTLGDGIKNAIPTEEELKESFTKLKNNLSPLKDIKLPEEVSFSAIKDSVVSMADALNTSFTNLTGIDVGEKLKNIGTAVGNKVSDLASSFENITGITIPSFDEVKTKLTNLGTNLAAKFEGLTGINLGEKFDNLKEMLPDIGNPLKGLADSLEKADFSVFGYNVGKKLASVIRSVTASDEEMVDKKAMGGAITGGKPYLVGEMGPELILPSGSGQVMNAQRTEQILSSGINRGMQGMGSGGPAIVNAPVNTVNNSQSNMTSTSTPMFHPSPLLGAVNVAA